MSCSICQEPALRVAVILLKYGPWRQALLDAWKARVTRGLSADDRARSLMESLAMACHAMHGVDDEAWISNLGRNVSHCSGPLIVLKRLGLLTNSSTGLCLGKSVRKVCKNASVLKRIVKWVHLADELGSWGVGPRTCHEWVAAHDRLLEVFGRHDIEGLRPARSGGRGGNHKTQDERLGVGSCKTRVA